VDDPGETLEAPPGGVEGDPGGGETGFESTGVWGEVWGDSAGEGIIGESTGVWGEVWGDSAGEGIIGESTGGGGDSIGESVGCEAPPGAGDVDTGKFEKSIFFAARPTTPRAGTAAWTSKTMTFLTSSSKRRRTLVFREGNMPMAALSI